MEIIRVKAPNGREIPIDKNQLENYLKAGCVVIPDEQIIFNSEIKPPEIEETLICPLCGFKAKSKNGLKTHKKRKHDIK